MTDAHRVSKVIGLVKDVVGNVGIVNVEEHYLCGYLDHANIIIAL